MAESPVVKKLKIALQKEFPLLVHQMFILKKKPTTMAIEQVNYFVRAFTCGVEACGFPIPPIIRINLSFGRCDHFLEKE